MRGLGQLIYVQLRTAKINPCTGVRIQFARFSLYFIGCVLYIAEAVTCDVYREQGERRECSNTSLPSCDEYERYKALVLIVPDCRPLAIWVLQVSN